VFTKLKDACGFVFELLFMILLKVLVPIETVAAFKEQLHTVSRQEFERPCRKTKKSRHMHLNN
jgi:hypothetical protein